MYGKPEHPYVVNICYRASTAYKANYAEKRYKIPNSIEDDGKHGDSSAASE